jgi:Ca-activated chloride channel family protein
MKKIFIGLLLIITIIFASESPKAVIVFDASGSMWGKVDGKTKIEIARASLKNLINDWNPNVQLGLIAYGHRKKGDCNDIETIIPVGEIDKSRMISTVLSIMPKGKTPISRSIKKAAQELRYTEEKATVILISDGKETCDMDPCATAKELENEGIDFVTHVIGFNVDQKTDEQLECIASATGGEYFSAKNATALNDAMRSIVKKVEIVESVKKVEPKPVVKKLKNNLVITASEKEGGRWVETYHEIYPIIDGEKQDYLKNCWSKKKEECKEQIPVGNYILSSKYNEFKKDTEFEVKAGEVTKLNIIMGQTGEVEITATEKEGGRWVETYHEIYPIIDGEKQDYLNNCWSKKKKECKEQIPLGKYILSSKYNEFKKDTEFEIKAGEVTKLNIVFEPFRVEVKCKTPDTQVSYEVYSLTGKMVADKQQPCSETLDLVLESGRYSVEAKTDNNKKDVEFTIGSGDSKITIDLTK